MNPIEVEIHRHMFQSIAEETGVVLRRTALSANIKERLDFSCAITGRDGAMVAQAAHIPVHLGSCHLTARQILDAVDLEDGDVVIVNDPFRGGTHLPDITLFQPVFLEGARRPAFGVITRAHHADVGGGVPGSMGFFDEIYKEGLVIPPVRIVRRGELDADVLEMILANVRTPDERRGDLLAQIAATQRGAGRLEELAARYGARTLRRAADALMDRAERAMEAVIAEVPDGDHRFADHLDGPGTPRIAVTIAVRGARAVVDFGGSDPQMEGSLNAHEAITLSAVFYAIRCLGGEDVPTNSGCLRPVRVVIPRGSIVGAEHPAAVAGGNVETSQRIVDVLFGALARAVPDRIPAASQGSMNNLSLGRTAVGGAFTYFETIAGGCGASPRRAGASGLHSHMTNTMNTPIEALEVAMPVRVTAYHLRRGSGGAGARRGGDGVVREIEALAPMTATILATRRNSAPYGLRGGKPGKPGRDRLVGASGRRRALAPNATVRLERGDRIRVETPGGGGHGRPPRPARPLE